MVLARATPPSDTVKANTHDRSAAKSRKAAAKVPPPRVSSDSLRVLLAIRRTKAATQAAKTKSEMDPAVDRRHVLA